MTELGNRLREARLAKGLSLDDLQTITKIQKRYLTGIEEGNYELMPGNFYVRAFIKQYSEAVGLDPEEILENYKEEIPSVRHEELPDQLSRVKSRKSITESNSKVFALIPSLLVVVFVIGAIGLLYYFLQQNADGDANEPVDDKKAPISVVDDISKDNDDTEKEDAGDEGKKDEAPSDEPKQDAPKQELSVKESNGSQSVYELKNADKFELKLESTGETWVEVKNGKGYSFFRGMLQKGGTESKTLDLTKETEIIVVVGRTLDTELYVNNEKLEYAVAPTDVVRQDITIRNIPASE